MHMQISVFNQVLQNRQIYYTIHTALCNAILNHLVPYYTMLYYVGHMAKV